MYVNAAKGENDFEVRLDKKEMEAAECFADLLDVEVSELIRMAMNCVASLAIKKMHGF